MSEHDRRQQFRVQLQWPVRLFAGAGEAAIHTRTENVSSTGFYCVCPRSFSPGDRLRCIVHIPGWRRAEFDGALELDCSVEVLRVDHDGAAAGQYGVAFSIHDYCTRAAVTAASSFSNAVCRNGG